MRIIPSNTSTAALRRVFFTLVDGTDFTTPKDITVTGVKASLSIDGGTPANSTNDITKLNGTNGQYYLELTQSETNQTAGTVIRGYIKPTGCALTTFSCQIFHSTVFDTTIAANVTQWNGSNVATPASAGHPVVTLKVGTGTGELNVASGKAPATIAAGDIANGTITSGTIAADAITDTKIATGALTSGKFASGAITSTVLADNAITAAKINSGAITVDKIADNAITAAKIGSDAITAAKIAASAITAAKIDSSAITADKIATDAITGAKIATDAVNKIQDGLATSTLLTEVAGYVDTEVAAIKAKTDQLVFTKTNELDVNVQSINDVTITGDGSTNNKFGV
jgi:hypothetical protein